MQWAFDNCRLVFLVTDVLTGKGSSHVAMWWLICRNKYKLHYMIIATVKFLCCWGQFNSNLFEKWIQKEHINNTDITKQQEIIWKTQEKQKLLTKLMTEIQIVQPSASFDLIVRKHYNNNHTWIYSLPFRSIICKNCKNVTIELFNQSAFKYNPKFWLWLLHGNTESRNTYHTNFPYNISFNMFCMQMPLMQLYLKQRNKYKIYF